MPRPLRHNRPDLFYHVMSRGNARQATFLGPEDHAHYLRLLELACRRFETEIHAYCLMPNHVHLLIRNRHAALPRFMQWLLGTYAVQFNAAHGRVGHLFQGRYKTRVILDNDYLFEVGRYIHMNPVAAGLTQAPERYPWSSLRAYLGLEPRGAISCDVLLNPFLRADRPAERTAFYRFTCARRPSNGCAELAGPLEDPREGRRPTSEAEPLVTRMGLDLTVAESRCAPGGLTAETALQLSAQAFQCDPGLLRSAARNPRRGWGRAVWMLLLRERSPLSLSEVAASTGMRNPRSVCNTIARLEARMAQDPSLSKVVQELLASTAVDLEPSGEVVRV